VAQKDRQNRDGSQQIQIPKLGTGGMFVNGPCGPPCHPCNIGSFKGATLCGYLIQSHLGGPRTDVGKTIFEPQERGFEIAIGDCGDANGERQGQER